MKFNFNDTVESKLNSVFNFLFHHQFFVFSNSFNLISLLKFDHTKISIKLV
ncbi:MAG: hypothetical protein WCG25_08760 [bacterium]